MTSVLPHRFLFRPEYRVPRVDPIPRPRDQRILNLGAECRLPDLGELDGVQPFYELSAAWNPHGIGFQLIVRGKERPPLGDFERPTESDGLLVWLNTRGLQNVHRATRFCHLFYFAVGSGPDTPAAGRQLPVPRAKEDAPLSDPDDLLVSSELLADGYRLEAWLPSAVLHGFDPEAQPQLGFCYVVRDSELGTQGLPAGPEFPYESDPSLWGTLNLAGSG